MTIALDNNEIRNVFFAVQRLLKKENIEELRRESLLLLQNLFQSEKSNFFLTNGLDHPVDLKLESVSSRGISDKSVRLFNQYYHQLDPFLKIIHSTTPPSQVVTFDQIIPFKKLVRTEYYNDFLKPQAIHDQMTIYLISGNQVLGVMALFRPRSAPVFSPADKAKARQIAPFLTAALERAISIKKTMALKQALNTIVPDLPYDGIMVLDRFMTPIYCNETAGDIISELHLTKGRRRPSTGDLPVELYKTCKDLTTTINSSMPADPPRLNLDVRNDRTGKKVTVHLRVLLDDNSSPRLLLCFNPKSQPLKSDTALRQLGISPRELDIIHLLAEGKKNSEIAAALFISEYTVENHLRSIYRKMNVKNRTALVYKLMKIAS